MLTVGFVVTPGFPVMSLAALSVFEFANYSAQEKLYDISLIPSFRAGKFRDEHAGL
jgi:transcriptional regulator GlxA family with amidase domain